MNEFHDCQWFASSRSPLFGGQEAEIDLSSRSVGKLRHCSTNPKIILSLRKSDEVPAFDTTS